MWRWVCIKVYGCAGRAGYWSDKSSQLFPLIPTQRQLACTPPHHTPAKSSSSTSLKKGRVEWVPRKGTSYQLPHHTTPQPNHLHPHISKKKGPVESPPHTRYGTYGRMILTDNKIPSSSPPPGLFWEKCSDFLLRKFLERK